MVNKVEVEILEVTGIKPKAKEDRQRYLTRLVKAGEAIDETEFDALSQATQEWVNMGIKADELGKDIEDFPDDSDDNNGSADTDETMEDDEVVTSKKEKNLAKEKTKKPSVKSADKPTKSAVKAEKAEKGPSKMHAILSATLKNPKMKANELATHLSENGVEVGASTVSAVRSDFMRAVNFLDSKKLLVKNPFAG